MAPTFRRFGSRVAAIVVVLAGTLVIGQAPASAAPPAAGAAVIRRTAFGIPHILASDYRGLGLGAGYAFAQDNLCVLADDVVTLSGQRSLFFGPDGTTVYGDNNLASDLYHTWVNQSLVVELLLASPAPIGPSQQARDLVRGYVAGYNRYLAEHPVPRLPDP